MRDRTKTVFIFVSIIVFLFSTFIEVFAFRPLKPVRPGRRPAVKRRFIPAPIAVRPVRQGPKHIWMRRYKLPSGVYIGGFWRPPCRASFTWVDGRWNDEGKWVFGYCKPVKIRAGYLWVPGYRDGGKWFEGYWRPASRAGFVWVPGHYNASGIWIKGHWKKL